MTQKNRALYIGRIGLPNDAASIRVFNISQMLHNLGYTVDILCLKASSIDQNPVKYNDWLTYYFTDSKHYLSTFDKIKSTFELITSASAYRRIIRHIESTKPSVVLLYNDLFFLSLRLTGYCKKHNIKLVADVTEWYEKRAVKQNLADYIVPYLTDKRIRFIDRKVRNIIAISPYLTDYYILKGCNVFSLPPVFHHVVSESGHSDNKDYAETLRFIYAGSPGSKDIIRPFVNALKKVNAQQLRITLDIIGIDDQCLKNLMHDSDTDYTKYGVYAHGRVPHDDVANFLAKSDLSVLLRQNLRYAKAGFSTKLAECMLNGVAMFANSVGGSELVIENWEDGVVIDSASEDDILNALQRLLMLNHSEIMKMKRLAQEKAAKIFVADSYMESFKQYIDNLR